jgi:L-lactate dehydrogenase complex protein LldG
VTSRDHILAAVRANRPPAVDLPEVPAFTGDTAALWQHFSEALRRMGGKLAEAPPGASAENVVQQLFPDAQVICSAAPDVAGTRQLDGSEPRELADIDVSVVRAVFGVAETGSVFLSERELRIPAMAYLAQHLLVLLDPADIIDNLHSAYRHLGFKSARYAVLITGPSATADIEGVLIHGAQGVRSLTVVPLPRPNSNPAPSPFGRAPFS